MQTMNEIADYILDWEGGYSNNPEDPGGETKYGISKRAHPDEDIFNMSRDRAIGIYIAQYFRPMLVDVMLHNGASDLAMIVADTAVNLGVKQTTKLIQRSLGLVDDGWLGERTRQAIAGAIANGRDDKLIMDILILRLTHYTNLKTFDTFGRGWTRRVIDLLDQMLNG